MLAQNGGQGRLAVGAILGAAIAALFLLGLSTGRDGSVGNAQYPLFPLANSDGPPTTGPLAAAPQVPSATASLSVTLVGTTTTVTTTSTTVAPTTDSVVTTSAPPPTHPTASPTTPPTTVHTPTRTKPTKTHNPCWFIFC